MSFDFVSYSVTTGFALLFCFILLLICSLSSTLTFKRKQYFNLGISFVVISAIMEYISYALLNYQVLNRPLFLFFKTSEYIITPFIGLCFGNFLYKWKGRYFEYFIIAINFAIMIFNLFYGFVFQYKNGIYSHEIGYFLYDLSYFISSFYCICCGFLLLKKYHFRAFWILLAAVFCVLLCLMLQSFIGTIRIDYLILAVSCYLIYIFNIEVIQQTDSLTGLENRMSFDAKTDRMEKEASIILLDINDFKSCNDDFGHSFGDKVLSTYGKILKQAFSRLGHVYRIGGDEFCVIISKQNSKIRQAIQTLESLINKEEEKNKSFPSISYGIATYNPESENIQEAIKRSDENMYHRKKISKQNSR